MITTGSKGGSLVPSMLDFCYCSKTGLSIRNSLDISITSRGLRSTSSVAPAPASNVPSGCRFVGLGHVSSAESLPGQLYPGFCSCSSRRYEDEGNH